MPPNFTHPCSLLVNRNGLNLQLSTLSNNSIPFFFYLCIEILLSKLQTVIHSGTEMLKIMQQYWMALSKSNSTILLTVDENLSKLFNNEVGSCKCCQEM